MRSRGRALRDPRGGLGAVANETRWAGEGPDATCRPAIERLAATPSSSPVISRTTRSSESAVLRHRRH